MKQYQWGGHRRKETIDLLTKDAFRNYQTITVVATNAGKIEYAQPIIPLVVGNMPAQGGTFYVDENGCVSKEFRDMNHARPNFEILKNLPPAERVLFLRDHLDACINLTPSGPLRDAMTEANMALIRGADAVTFDVRTQPWPNQ